LGASLFAEDDEEEEAADPYFGGIQVRTQRFVIRVQGSGFREDQNLAEAI
jgi:hypothetical protein